MEKYPVLAIDYGSKRIGLAVSDTKGILARPLKVITLSPRTTYDQVIGELKKIISEYKIKMILLGVPVNYDDESQNSTTKKVMKFRDYITKRLDIPVQNYDENFSTITAQNMLLSTGQHAKRTKGKIDMVASAVFLQEFLNSQQKYE